MTDLITSLLTLLLVIVLVLVVTMVTMAGFLGVGAIFARFTELTLFQATIIAAFMGFGTFYVLNQIMRIPVYNEEDEWDEWDEWEDELDFEGLSPAEQRKVRRFIKELLEEEFGAENVVIEPKSQRRRHR